MVPVGGADHGGAAGYFAVRPCLQHAVILWRVNTVALLAGMPPIPWGRMYAHSLSETILLNGHKVSLDPLTYRWGALIRCPRSSNILRASACRVLHLGHVSMPAPLRSSSPHPGVALKVQLQRKHRQATIVRLISLPSALMMPLTSNKWKRPVFFI